MNILRIAYFLASGMISSFGQYGQFGMAMDIGNPKIKGSSFYIESTQTDTLNGGGGNIWLNHDDFHFLFKKISGDFILTANIELIGNNEGNGHRKTGWMIREDTDADAVSINSCLHGDGLTVLQWRSMRAYMCDPRGRNFLSQAVFR